MLHTTRWLPDTCGCVFEYEWDDAVLPAARQHTLKKVVKVCPEHAALADKDKYSQVVGENQTKNYAVGIVMKDKGVELDKIVWFWDGKRQLQLQTLTALSASDKASLQTIINTALGAGKVKVL